MQLGNLETNTKATNNQQPVSLDESYRVFSRGQNLLRLKRYHDAINEFDRVSRDSEHYVACLTEKSLCFLLTDQLEQARRTLEQVDSKNDHALICLIYLALTGIFNSQLTQTSISEEQKEEAGLIIAGILGKLLELEEFNAFEKALELVKLLNLAEGEDSLFLGKIYYKSGYRDVAVEELVKSYETTNIDDEGLFILGKVSYDNGLFEDARIFFLEYLRSGYKDISAYMLLSSVLMKLGEIEEALKVLDEAIREYPDSTDLADIFMEVTDIMRDTKYAFDSIFKGRAERNSANLVTGGDYNKLRKEFMQYFTELAGLKPEEKVLEVGYSIGRMAVPLAKYITQNGSYEGIGVISKDVYWCKKNLSSNCSNFNFTLADINHPSYNPDGKHNASEYKLPFEDNSFNFAFLISVFTHMLPEEIENFLGEVARVLKKGGRCLITYLLSNDESIELVNAGKATLAFKNEGSEHSLQEFNMIGDWSAQGDLISHDESHVLALYKRYGLEIAEQIHYGFWCGREHGLSFQDIIIATKT